MVRIVTFELGSELFGLPVSRVREITMDQDVTNVPKLPQFFNGVIDLRGEMIPIIEGVDRLDMDPQLAPDPGNGRILIVELQNQKIGVRVNCSDEVINVREEQFRPAPEMVGDFGAEFVTSMVEYDFQSNKKSESMKRRNQSSRQSELSRDESINEQDDNKNNVDKSKKTILLIDLKKLFSPDELEKIEKTESNVN